MEEARILVAFSNESLLIKMKTVLTEGGFSVMYQAREGNECLRSIRTLKLDLAVLDYDLPMLNGLEVAKIAAEDKLCDIILVVNNEKKSTFDYIKSSYDFTVLSKPLNRDILLSTIELMLKNRRKILMLEKEIGELKTRLDARKEIEKAKGLLMKHLHLTEEQAFRRIQKQSMDRSLSMRDIARAIILTYEL